MKDARLNALVFGAGAWGTALAAMLAREGRSVLLVARGREKANRINENRENSASLPGIPLPESLSACSVEQTSLWQDAAARSPQAMVLLATPAQTTRTMLGQIAPSLGPAHPLILTAKGLERSTHALLSDIAQDVAPALAPSILSGPSFAHDVGRGLPTAVTLASATVEEAERLCERLRGRAFRPYASDDRLGVQLGGALKNVLAIAAGIVAGRGLGESAKAALITRGFAEMSRLSLARGAAPRTLTGLSGLGDLVLTCSTAGSRNFAFGYRLGEGASLDGLLADGQPLAEGAKTASAALDLAQDAQIDMPITQTVAAVVAGALSVDAAIGTLLARPLKRETD